MASVVLCLGCGSTINQSSDRRNLSGKSSTAVLSAWKEVIKAELEKRGCLAVFESLFTSDGLIQTKNHGNQKNMCRKCFYLYEKTIKCQEVCVIIVFNKLVFYCYIKLYFTNDIHVGNKFKHDSGSRFSRNSRLRYS